jgi:hypothetical protein
MSLISKDDIIIPFLRGFIDFGLSFGEETTPTTPISIISSFYQALLAELRSVSWFQPEQCFISLFPEVYPLAGSPLCIVTPGEFHLIDPQANGGGRYVSGVQGTVYVHVVGRNLMDTPDRMDYFMTSVSDGILPIVKSVIDKLEYTFIYDAEGNPITQEPLWVVDQSPPVRYTRAGEWAGVRLGLNVALLLGLEPAGPGESPLGETATQEGGIGGGGIGGGDEIAPFLSSFIDFGLLPDITDGGVTPPASLSSSLGGLLPAVQGAITSSLLFPPSRCMLGVESEPYPLAGSPFCVVSPGRMDEYESYGRGGGRFTSRFTAPVTCHVITRAWQDTMDRDTNLMLNPTEGVIARSFGLIDNLHMGFLRGTTAIANPELFLTDTPIRFVRLGQPRRYGKAGQWGGIPVEFEANFLHELDQSVIC